MAVPNTSHQTASLSTATPIPILSLISASFPPHLTHGHERFSLTSNGTLSWCIICVSGRVRHESTLRGVLTRQIKLVHTSPCNTGLMLELSTYYVPFYVYLVFWFLFLCLLGRVIISGFQQILKNEGLPGLYRGLSPTIVALFPTWAVRNRSSYIFYQHRRTILLRCNRILA